MAEKNANLWAPWRMEYIHSLHDQAGDPGCFLCQYWANPGEDERNHVVWRGQSVFVVMNRFPYTNGHLLIASAGHVGELHQLEEAALHEMSRVTRDAVRLLIETIHPQGFNIGINLGRCAGAGLPEHIHTHIVPRWQGDTNYMAVIGDARVIPQSIEALYRRLREALGGVIGVT